MPNNTTQKNSLYEASTACNYPCSDTTIFFTYNRPQSAQVMNSFTPQIRSRK